MTTPAQDLDKQRLIVDNESLKNTLYGVNEKLVVFNDLKKDVSDHQRLLQESESARAALQQVLQKSAVTLKDEAAKNLQFQSALKASTEAAHQERSAVEAQMKAQEIANDKAKQDLKREHQALQQNYIN